MPVRNNLPLNGNLFLRKVLILNEFPFVLNIWVWSPLRWRGQTVRLLQILRPCDFMVPVWVWGSGLYRVFEEGACVSSLRSLPRLWNQTVMLLWWCFLLKIKATKDEFLCQTLKVVLPKAQQIHKRSLQTQWPPAFCASEDRVKDRAKGNWERAWWPGKERDLVQAFHSPKCWKGTLGLSINNLAGTFFFSSVLWGFILGPTFESPAN